MYDIFMYVCIWGMKAEGRPKRMQSEEGTKEYNGLNMFKVKSYVHT